MLLIETKSLRWWGHLSFCPLVNEVLLDLSGPHYSLLSLVACSTYTQHLPLLTPTWFLYCFFYLTLVSLNTSYDLLIQELHFKPRTPLVFCASLNTGAYELLVWFRVTHEWKESYGEFFQDRDHIIKLICVPSHPYLAQSRRSINVFWICGLGSPTLLQFILGISV